MDETKIESLTSRIEISTPGRGFCEISGELQQSFSGSAV